MILPLNELNERVMRAHALMAEAMEELSLVDLQASCRHHGMRAESAASPLAVRTALQTAFVRSEAASLWIRAIQHDQKEALNAHRN